MELIDVHNRTLRKLDDYSKGVSLPKSVLDEEIGNEADGKTTVVVKTYKKENGNIVFEATINPATSAEIEDVGNDEDDGDMCLDDF